MCGDNGVESVDQSTSHLEVAPQKLSFRDGATTE